MLGQVIKIFSDFYYVNTVEGIVEAKLRSILKKQNAEVYTGDFVKLEQFDKNSMQAFICEIVERKSLISRPKVANITQVIIVSALKEPDLNFEQLDRYIAHCELHNIKPVLCFNKEDIIGISYTRLLSINLLGEVKGKKTIIPTSMTSTTSCASATGDATYSQPSTSWVISLPTIWSGVSRKPLPGTRKTGGCNTHPILSPREGRKLSAERLIERRTFC